MREQQSETIQGPDAKAVASVTAKSRSDNYVGEFDSLFDTVGDGAYVTEKPVIEPTPGVGDYALDMLKAVPAGVERGVIGARETVRAIGRAVLPESLKDEALQGPLIPG